MSVSAHIQKYRKTDDGHTEFFVKVFYKGREWSVNKRFSDFVKLDEYLKKNGYNLNCHLPQKTWWNRFDTSILNQRQKDLQGYLDMLLKSTLSSENALVKEFLEVDNKLLEFAKKSQFRGLYLENLAGIVSETRSAMIKIAVTNPASYIAKRESLSNSASGSFKTSTRLNSPVVGLKRSDSVDSSFGSFRERESERAYTYSNGNSSNFISEAHAAVTEAARREQLLGKINGNKQCKMIIADVYKKLDKRVLPVADHDVEEVEYILSVPDPISSILTSILEQEVNSIIEASPQTRIALVGSKLLRQFKNTSSSNQHSSSDLLRASIGRANSLNSNMSSSPLSQSPFTLTSLPMRINNSSTTWTGSDSNSTSNSNSLSGSPLITSSLPRSIAGSLGGQTSPTKIMQARKIAEETKNISFDFNDTNNAGTSLSASNISKQIPNNTIAGIDSGQMSRPTLSRGSRVDM